MNRRRVLAGPSGRTHRPSPPCQSGPLPVPYQPHTRRRPAPICGWGVSPGKGTWDFVVDGTWPPGGRFYAARLYAQPWGHLPQNWQWAAPKFKISAPTLFAGASGSAHERIPAVSTSSQHYDTVPNTAVNEHINRGVSPKDGDLSNRPSGAERGVGSPSPSPSTPFGNSMPSLYCGNRGSQRPVDQQVASRPRRGHRVRTPTMPKPDTPPGPRPTVSPSQSWNQGWNRQWKCKMKGGAFLLTRNSSIPNCGCPLEYVY